MNAIVIINLHNILFTMSSLLSSLKLTVAQWKMTFLGQYALKPNEKSLDRNFERQYTTEGPVSWKIVKWWFHVYDWPGT